MKATEAACEAVRLELVAAINDVLRERGIKQTDGPAMAYFEQPALDGSGKSERHAYVSFANHGRKVEGESAGGGAKTPDEMIKSAVAGFKAWLEGDRTLVWRHHPSVEFGEGLWWAYFRCVQIGSSAEAFPVMVYADPAAVVERRARKLQSDNLKIALEALAQAFE